MAQYIITTSDADDIRIRSAFGQKGTLHRSATSDEVKKALIQFIKSVVRNQERIVELNALITANPPITPT